MAQLNPSDSIFSHKSKGALRRTLFFALLIGTFGAANAEFEFSTNSLVLSGPQPIGEFGKDWSAPLQSETDSFGYIELSIAYTHESTYWRFSRVRSIHAQPTSDTTRFYHAEKNNTPLVAGERYQLGLSLQQIDYSRLSAGRHFTFNHGKTDWRVDLGVLAGHQFIDGNLTGEAIAIDSQDYDFSFAIDYQYSDDPLFERPMNESVRGLGLAVDVALEHDLSEYASLYLDINNVLSGLWWGQAGSTNGAASSERKTRDSNGFVTFDPIFRGRETNRDFVSKLPLLAQVKLVRRIGPTYEIQFQAHHTPTINWFALGAGRRIGAFKLSGEWIPSQAAFGLALSGRNLELRFVTDDLVVDDAHHVQINAKYGFVF
jgi:hypothetical protein